MNDLWDVIYNMVIPLNISFFSWCETFQYFFPRSSNYIPHAQKKVNDMIFEGHVEGEHLNDSIIFLIK